MSLDQGSIMRMVHMDEASSNPSFCPTVQIYKVIPVVGASNASQKRYRVILSDGQHHCQGMLATQNNYRVESNEIADFTIVRITDHMKNLVQGKTLIILLGFDIVSNPGYAIGSPVPVDSAPVNATGAGGIKAEESSSAANPYHAPPAPVTSSAPIHRTTAPISNKNITPINALNMYQNRWTIKARVTNKGDVKHWSNAKGEGSLFSCELLDSSGTDIKCTFFREAVDKFHPLLEVDKVYTFSGGKLKAANMQYNTCKSSFEITFDQNAEIHLENDTGDIVQQVFDLVPIGSLESVEPGKYVDIIGIVKHVGEPSTLMSKKTGKELEKCELTIADDSGAEVHCTVWGEKARNAPVEYANFPVVAMRKCRVSDYGGRTLSVGTSVVNPRIPEAQRVSNWWHKGGSQHQVKSLTSSGGGGAGRYPEFDQRKSVASIKSEHLGYNEKPDYISFKGTVTFIKSDKEGGAWYQACPNAEEPCKNRYKVSQGIDGTFHCERCGGTYNNCMHRFIFSAIVTDDTSSSWVSVFDDQARTLLNTTADELQKVKEVSEDDYDGEFIRANFTDWVFTCKVKNEMHQDEQRVKTSVQAFHPMDYAKEGRSIFNALMAM